MKSFLIAPVRGFRPDQWAKTIENLTKEGFDVYWPQRDTDQRDQVGLQICSQNAAAIAHAEVVHVIWDGLSQGCLFDLGIAFAMKKKIIVLDLPPPTEGKSFQNMLRAWAASCGAGHIMSRP